MGFISEKLQSNEFDSKEYIEKVLNAIKTSSELSNSSLKAVISNSRNGNRATQEQVLDFKHFIQNVVSSAIIMYDEESAAKLAGIEDGKILSDIIMNNVKVKEGSPELDAILKLKDEVFNKVGYKIDDPRKNMYISSRDICPDIPLRSNDTTLQHCIVINPVAEAYQGVIRDILFKCLEEGIMFDMRVRDVSDWVYGFADPITIYTSTEYLDDLAHVTYSVLSNYPRQIKQTNKLLYLSQPYSFGYTSVSHTDGNSPMEIIIKRIEYHLKNRFGTDDWSAIAQKLKGLSNDEFTGIINSLDRSIFYANEEENSKDQLDLNNIYVFGGILSDEPKNRYEDLLGEAPIIKEKQQLIETPIEQPVEVKEEVVTEVVNSAPVVEGVQEEPIQEEVEDDSSLDNLGAYSNTGEIEVQKLTTEEAESIVNSNNSYKFDDVEPLSEDIENMIFGSRGGFNAITAVTVDSEGNSMEMSKYLHSQKVEELLNKTVIIKDGVSIYNSDLSGVEMDGLEFIQKIVVPKFQQNTTNNINTLNSVINEYVARLKEKPVKKILGIFPVKGKR